MLLHHVIDGVRFWELKENGLSVSPEGELVMEARENIGVRIMLVTDTSNLLMPAAKWSPPPKKNNNLALAAEH